MISFISGYFMGTVVALAIVFIGFNSSKED